MIPLIDLKREYQYLKDELHEEIRQVLESGSFILGQKGQKLEKEVAQFIGTSYSIGVANGTDALLLSLEALGIGAGDEVITSPFTFFATAEVVARVGATPVFVDIDSQTYNLDPKLVEQAITPKTKAIIVVHLFGQPADMAQIMQIARQHNFFVIEDACQAIGATYQRRKAGSFGELGCFSFFPSKNLGAYGDAGMIVTDNQELFEKVTCLRNHGSTEKYIHSHIGINSRLDEIQAAILLVKLKRLDEWNQRRRVIAAKYTEKLGNIVLTPIVAADRQQIFHQYCIETDHRDQLVSYLNQKKIATAIYYPVPLHLQPVFKYLHYQTGDLPNSERAAKRIAALPIFPLMTEKKQEIVISRIQEFMEEKKWIYQK